MQDNNVDFESVAFAIDPSERHIGLFVSIKKGPDCVGELSLAQADELLDQLQRVVATVRAHRDKNRDRKIIPFPNAPKE
jgi:hypothetical protein